ncbi:MAG: type IX secretion system outer membrane channel protein PorV [Chitinophagaceae bacterium]|nr:type IX secretion system outer membrane channel protein PorV [Chitinophagaceae bacterium]
MKSFNKIIAAAIVSIAAPYMSVAQSDKSINVVTTAVPFLSISPDARSGGMGEAGIAVDPDANAVFRNLAKMPFTESKSGVGATYSPWLRKLGLNDVYLTTLSGYTKLDDNQAISASLRYFSMGNINFTDNMGNQLGSARPREFSIDAGYSRKLSERMGLAIALRYINSNLTGGRTIGQTTYKTGNAVAGDLSLYYNAQNVDGQGWSFGATMTNVGTKIGYTTDASQKDFIPANLGLGVAYTKVYDEQNKISFGLDVNKLMVPTPPASGDSMALVNYRNKGVINGLFSSFGDAPGGFSEELKEFQIGGGLEYTYNNQFAARAGYFHENKTKGNRQYFTVGAGVRYTIVGINFSYIIPNGSGINENPLSNTLRFSAVLDIK